jgi:UDP-N-acetyl-2-amino-2-deoxyglucuronate dehydrogenase
MKKVKFALIGCGRVSNWHANAIKNIDNAELVAVCDLVEERAFSMAKEHNAKYYTNYHRMLQEEDIDVVNVITPSGMHAEHALDIITNYRKHVVVEKPMALRVEDCEKLMDAAKENNVGLYIVMQNRFNKAVLKTKEAIDNNMFGRFVLGTVRLRWSRPQRYYDRDPWRGTWAFDGGVFTNQAIHHIDLLRWLMGDVEGVSGIASTRLVDVEVEDTAAVWLRFKNGAMGIIEATTAARPNDLEASISILGENGTVIIEGTAVNKITTWTFNEIDMREFSEEPPNVYGFGHLPLLEGVAKSIIKGPSFPIDEGGAINTIKLLSAIYSSVEQQGKYVRLKDNPISSKLGIIKHEDKKIKDLYTTPRLQVAAVKHNKEPCCD